MDKCYDQIKYLAAAYNLSEESMMRDLQTIALIYSQGYDSIYYFMYTYYLDKCVESFRRKGAAYNHNYAKLTELQNLNAK